MDAAQWSEGLGVVKSMEPKKTTIRAQKPQALSCPRCNSAHTKFCYYNNYSLSQPRYFCKTCRRYWTEGGSLRNVPVGGGSRRNKRSSSATVAASISNNQHHVMMAPPVPTSLITQNPSKNVIHGQSQGQGQDLNLAYSNISREFVNLPYNPNATTTSSSSQLLKNSGFSDPRGVIMNSFPNTMIMNSQGFNFSLNGFGNGGGYHHHHGSTMSTTTTTAGTSANPRILFPFQDLKPISTSNGEVVEPTRGQGDSSSGYWGGGLGGESW